MRKALHSKTLSTTTISPPVRSKPGQPVLREGLRIGEGHMTDHLWPAKVSDRLGAFLAGAFTGVRFDVLPLVAYDVATIDVAWTDGPALHEVDLLALEYILHLQLDTGSPASGAGTRIDRISKRRTMSPAVESRLLNVLAAELNTDVERLDMERMYPLPPVLASSQCCANGLVGEFLDLLFESTSISAVGGLSGGGGGTDTLLCRCVLCA